MNRTLPVIAFCVLCSSLYGHGGKTDSKGGHFDKKTGSYHSHGGGGGSDSGASSIESAGVVTQPKTESKTKARTQARTSYRTEPRPPERIDPEKLEYKILVSKELGTKCYCRVKITNQDSPSPSSLQGIPQEIFLAKASWVFVFPKDGEKLLGVVVTAPRKNPVWKPADEKGNTLIKDPWAEEGRFADRLWHDAKGTHSVEAAFGSRAGKSITLVRPNKETFEIDYDKLSEKDRKWIETSADLLP